MVPGLQSWSWLHSRLLFCPGTKHHFWIDGFFTFRGFTLDLAQISCQERKILMPSTEKRAGK